MFVSSRQLAATVGAAVNKSHALARAISFPSPGKRRDAGNDDEEARPATWRDRAASFVTRGKFRRLGSKPGVETRRPSLDSDVNRLSDGDLRT